MSRIDDLIRQYAPHGVEHATLGALAVISNERVNGSELDEATYVGVDNLLPDFGGRRDSTYGVNSSGAVRFRTGDVLLGNIRPYLRKVWLADRDGGASPDVLTISLTSRGRARLMPGFLYRLLASDPFISYSMQHAKGAKMPRGDKKATLAYRIPVPPLEVQRVIVRTLDSLTALEAELRRGLQSELEGRRAQHAHYRAAFLHSEGGEPGVELDGLVDFVNGKAHERLVVADGTVALLTARFISTSGQHVRRVNPEDALTPVDVGDIAMVMSDLPNGRALARCFHVDANGRYTANQRVCRLRVRDPDLVSPRWLYHFLDRNPQLLAFDNGQEQTHLKKGQVLGIRVPILPLVEQERVVALLDELDRGNRELSSALTAELAARRQQYAYYRDRLLTFEEAVA